MRAGGPRTQDFHPQNAIALERLHWGRGSSDPHGLPEESGSYPDLGQGRAVLGRFANRPYRGCLPCRDCLINQEYEIIPSGGTRSGIITPVECER
jgi:hypothetical protein